MASLAVLAILSEVETGALRVAGVLVALGVIGVALRRLFRFTRKAVSAVKHADAAINTLGGIAAQFQPNGGSSLHDVVARIEEKADSAATEATAARVEVRELRDLITEAVVENPPAKRAAAKAKKAPAKKKAAAKKAPAKKKAPSAG